MPAKKTWNEKLADAKNLPRVVPIPPRMEKTCVTGTLAIPAPHEIDELMRQVPKGKLTTTNELRAAVARRHGATIGCPLTTGIFSWIAANAAAESAAAGRKRITPYWRTLKTGGELNAKFPGGLAQQHARLEAEGHTIIAKGKRHFVADFAKCLHAF